MKHRNILFYIVLYMAVCVSWALYARYHLLMPIDSWINLASILLHLSFFHALYICLVQMPTRAFTLRSFWPALPVVLISLSVLEKTYVIVLVLLGALILSLFLCQLFHRRERIHWFSWILVLLSAAAYGFSYRVIPAILILVALVYDTYRRYGYKKIDQLSLLPTSQENQMKAIPLLIVFLTVVFYLMEFSVMEINIVFHVIVISYSLFLLLNMETLSTPYEDVESLYLLVSYVGQEREAFSRLIHDEMIQDIRASKNALILKEVDIPLAVEILTNLEEKSRKMMNYYSQHIFEDYTVEENIHNLLAAIQALYPQQNISMKIEMDDTLGKCDQKDSVKNLV